MDEDNTYTMLRRAAAETDRSHLARSSSAAPIGRASKRPADERYRRARAGVRVLCGVAHTPRSNDHRHGRSRVGRSSRPARARCARRRRHRAHRRIGLQRRRDDGRRGRPVRAPGCRWPARGGHDPSRSCRRASRKRDSTAVRLRPFRVQRSSPPAPTGSAFPDTTSSSNAGGGLLRDALAGAGAGVDPATADVVRVESGRPRFGRDMDEHTIPLEAGIEDRAISFTKGCYVGQEVIIRVLHRGGGRVARRLVGLTLERDAPPGSQSWPTLVRWDG